MHRTTVLDGIAALERLAWAQRVEVCGRQHYLLDVPRLLALRPPNQSPTTQSRSPTATGVVAHGDRRLNQSGTDQEPSEGACGQVEKRTRSQQVPARLQPVETEASKIQRLEDRRSSIPALRGFRRAGAFESADAYRAAQDVACQCWESTHRNPRPEERFGRVASASRRVHEVVGDIARGRR
jgi:hypothetical protein